MKNQYLSGIFCLLSIILFDCGRDEFTYPKKLDGDWKIAKSERWIIFNDGSTEKFEDLTDAGTLQIFEPNPTAETLKEFIFTYTNFKNEEVEIQSLLKTDEDSKRIFFSKVLCDSPFECDIVWTVDENKKNSQVWSAYGNQDNFFYSSDRYNPSNDTHHYKWTITLEK